MRLARECEAECLDRGGRSRASGLPLAGVGEPGREESDERRSCRSQRQSLVFARRNKHRNVHIHADFPVPEVCEWLHPSTAVSSHAGCDGLIDVLMRVAVFYYYHSSLGGRIDDMEQEAHARRGDGFWLFGYTMLFLAPSLILFSIGLLFVASVWLALWLVYLIFVFRYLPKVQTPPATQQKAT
jgi:hypothetical protein